MSTASAWLRSASSAAPRRCTESWSAPSPRYLGKDDAILFAACFDANGGVFEPLLGAEDAIISDALNHASIIDGVRLCKAKRYRFANGDMNDLEGQLKSARADGARHIVIATDGVFSMDGYLADLGAIDRSRRALWRQRPGRRLPCHRLHRTEGQGHAGTAQASPARSRSLPARSARRLGGAMGGYVAASQPDHRSAAPARQALSFLQFPGAARRGRHR